jgi:hypothetical protein
VPVSSPTSKVSSAETRNGIVLLSHFLAVDRQRGEPAFADTSTVVLEAEFDSVFALVVSAKLQISARQNCPR